MPERDISKVENIAKLLCDTHDDFLALTRDDCQDTIVVFLVEVHRVHVLKDAQQMRL